MAIIGKTKLAILRALDKGPVHGYLLSKRISASQSSIYEHLAELERAGLVEAKEVGRRVVYSLTKEGRLIVEGSRKLK